jgi:hypothetical protein
MRESIKEQIARIAKQLNDDVTKQTPITTKLRRRPLGLAEGYEFDGRDS